MSLNIKSPIKSLSATAIAFLLVATPDLGAQILQPGLQPGLARAPDSARKISLDGAIAPAQQNSPQAIQAEGTERTSKAARVSASGAILPSATPSRGHVVQVGNAQLALITAQTEKEAADAQLTRLVGSPVPVTADPASVQENMAALPDSAELARLALNGPAVQQAQAGLDAAKEDTKASKA